MGDRRLNLEQALVKLAPQVRVIRRSSIYDTAPQENPNQPRFLNMVVRAQTTLPPEHLLALAKSIEGALGRVASPPNSPRPIDIDILFYDKLIQQSPGLVIPHPRLAQRSFVLVPLAEIAPRLLHPCTQKTVREMLSELRPETPDEIKCHLEKEPPCIN